MSEKMFKLSRDYLRLWELLHSGATVVYRVNQEQIFDEVGLIKNEGCQHIPMSIRYTDEDGFKVWRDIALQTFVSECKRLNLQFFDEATEPEPNMFWLAGAEEAPAVEMPLRIAEEIEEDIGIGIGIVECAVRLPDRKMRVWTEKNTDGDEETKWEWVSE